MKYTVGWTPDAEGQLAEIWLRAENRTAVADASNRIDRLLGREPESLGEPQDNGTRILVIPPLAITFEFASDDNRVTVLSIRYRSAFD